MAYWRRVGMMAACIPLAAACLAQTPAPEVAFDVVSVKPVAASATPGVAIGIQVDGAQVHIAGVQLRDLIRLAYTVKNYQIVGPDTLSQGRYDVAATLPAGSTPLQVPQMLQSMLATSFGLKFHRDRRPLPVYALERESDFKLKPSAAAADLPDAARLPASATAGGSARGIALNLGGGSGYVFGDDSFAVTKLSMAVFADALSRYMDRPVIDDTGLRDGYSFSLALDPEDYRVMLIRAAVNSGVVLPPQALLDGASTSSLNASLGRIGLKLAGRTAPLERFVVDQIAATPSGN